MGLALHLSLSCSEPQAIIDDWRAPKQSVPIHTWIHLDQLAHQAELLVQQKHHVKPR